MGVKSRFLALRRSLRRKPHVGIAGFYGHGNYGDELFLHVFRRYLGKRAILSVIPDLTEWPFFSEPVRQKVEKLDAVLVGGGDLVRPQYGVDKRYHSRAYLRRSVYVAGIGVQRQVNAPAMKPKVIAVWREFMQHPAIKMIAARDIDSALWMEEFLSPLVPVGVVPDIVCSLPLPEVAPAEGQPVLGVVTRWADPLREYGEIQETARKLAAEGWKIRHIIAGTGIVGQRDIADAARLDVPGKEVIYSEDLDDISRALGGCSRVISMKLHATVVATLYGVPVLCVNPVAKTRAFLQLLGREDLVVNPDCPQMLEMVRSLPPVPMDRIAELQQQATDFMCALEKRIFADFKENRPVVRSRRRLSRI